MSGLRRRRIEVPAATVSCGEVPLRQTRTLSGEALAQCASIVPQLIG